MTSCDCLLTHPAEAKPNSFDLRLWPHDEIRSSVICVYLRQMLRKYVFSDPTCCRASFQLCEAFVHLLSKAEVLSTKAFTKPLKSIHFMMNTL